MLPDVHDNVTLVYVSVVVNMFVPTLHTALMTIMKNRCKLMAFSRSLFRIVA